VLGSGRNPRCFLFGPAMVGVCTVLPRANISLPKALSEQRRRGEGFCGHGACHHGGGKDWETVLSPSLKPCFSASLPAPVALSALAVFRISAFLLFRAFGEALSASELPAGEESRALILEHHHVLLESCDLAALSETWWDKSHDWSAASDGYRLFRRDRQGRRGGELPSTSRDVHSLKSCL